MITVKSFDISTVFRIIQGSLLKVSTQGIPGIWWIEPQRFTEHSLKVIQFLNVVIIGAFL